MDVTVKVWNVATREPVATLEGHTAAVWDAALSADGRLAASSGWDETVRLWDTGSGRVRATLRGHPGAVNAVALSADGRLVVRCGDDGMVRLWDTESGLALRTLSPTRNYERLDITGLTGVTESQRAALLALGAFETSA